MKFKLTGKSGLAIRITLLMVLFLVVSSFTNIALNSFSVGDLGYSSAFEGPKAQFYGVKYNGNTYTAASSIATKQFDTVLRFDPDEVARGKPNLVGEMTTVFVPSETLTSATSWIPRDWLSQNQYISNPQETYQWNISGKAYQMQQWLMKWYVTIGAEWDVGPLYNVQGGVGSTTPTAFGEEPAASLTSGALNTYTNTEVWLQFNIEPTWYLQGQGVAYFAIGKMQLANQAKYGGQDVNGKSVDARTTVSVSPESQASNLFLSYSPWGTDGGATKDASAYQGRELNTAYFRDKVYTRINLNSFGVSSWLDWGVQKAKGDTVTLAFDVTVFVIGEWQVKDIQNTPSNYGRFTRTYIPPTIVDYLLSPTGLGIMALAAGIILFIIILLFAPWIFTLIGQLLSSKGKESIRGRG